MLLEIILSRQTLDTNYSYYKDPTLDFKIRGDYSGEFFPATFLDPLDDESMIL